MELSREIADSIVKTMMQYIPYNINVMNASGIIIGSGDANRINTIHRDAQIAIDKGITIETIEAKPGTKQGINEPIFFEGHIIGVVGITGKPDDVRPYGKLVCAATTLIIKEMRDERLRKNQQLDKERFYNELLNRPSYGKYFIETAENYGMKIEHTCYVAIIRGAIDNLLVVNAKNFINKYANYYLLGEELIIFLTNQTMKDIFVKDFSENFPTLHAAIGKGANTFGQSLSWGRMVYEYGQKICPKNTIYEYDELKFYLHISFSDADKNELIDFSNLDESYIATLLTYIENNGDMSLTSNYLNIHRNTLQYRLNKIKKLTGKDPKKITDLFQLFLSLLIEKN